jgi:arsenite methyltransferase
VYVLAQLVRQDGHVHGVDMTEEQLAVARDTASWHADRFRYARPNTTFHRGYVEDLRAVGLDDASVDVVVSNCVANLSPRKDLVLAEVFRVLKAGGELYISDVFADRRLAPEVATDPVLYAECLGGGGKIVKGPVGTTPKERLAALLDDVLGSKPSARAAE